MGSSAAVAVTILPLLVRLASRSTGRATLAVSKGGEDVAQWPMSPYWCVRASVCAFTLSRLGLIYINCAALGGRETNLILRAIALSSLLFRRVFCRRECGVFVDPQCHICFWSAKLVWLWYKFSAACTKVPRISRSGVFLFGLLSLCIQLPLAGSCLALHSMVCTPLWDWDVANGLLTQSDYSFQRCSRGCHLN